MDYVKLFDQFSRLRVMVIGDVMLDSYIFGKVERISPEAPVPVVAVENRVSRLGGAANVALNLKALGAEPVLCSVIGLDAKGEEFTGLLAEGNISPDFIIRNKNRKTTTKYRIIGNNVQMLRVDEEITEDLSLEDQSGLLDRIFEIVERQKIDAIILEDYNKGVLTSEVISRVIDKARSHRIPVAVDPKKKNFLNFKGASLFKPNLKELREGLGMDIKSTDIQSLKRAFGILHEQYQISCLMVTLSDEGIYINMANDDGIMADHLVQAHKRTIADVSGAGDTVISVAALCLACGLDPVETATLSNLAGGLVCEEVGVVPVRRDKLLQEALKML